MGNLYIEEYQNIIKDNETGNAVPMLGNFRASQSIALDKMSTQSSPLKPTTRFIIITANVDCRFSIGDAPDATHSTRYLPATQSRYLEVQGGERVAAIADV